MTDDATRTGKGLRRRGALALLGAPLLATPFLAAGRGLGGLGEAPAPRPDPGPLRAEWAEFCARYLTPEGRVVDTGNGGDSHTEGQGIGLLVAAEVGDAAAFDRMLDWTRRNLRHRHHALHAWRWRPGVANPVSDPNNASDGDILVAWGMIRGAEAFNRPGLKAEAAATIRDLLTHCTQEVGGRLLLLPGMNGFERRDHVVVNPSYYVWPALAEFARVIPDRAWARLAADGQALVGAARFGRWNLPADWVEVPRDGRAPPRPAADWPARFSWDAVRVPLYAAWSRRWSDPALESCADFWAEPGFRNVVPAWADLKSNALAPYPGHAGVKAVAHIAQAARRRTGGPAGLPRVAEATDYYGAGLVLKAHLAWREAGRALATS